MLFQPSHITPSVLTGTGAIDATKSDKISWQLNGNSALTAWQYKIYTAPTSATQTPTLVYTSSKTTLGSPIYPTDEHGNPIVFDQISLSANILSNGNAYYLYITQFWQENGTEKSLTMSTPAYFITSVTPVITITGSGFVDSTAGSGGWYATTQQVSFSATVNSTVTVEKIRWTLTYYPGLYDTMEEHIVDDTGYVYTQKLSYTTPLLRRGLYSVSLEVITTDGMSNSVQQSFYINTLTLPLYDEELKVTFNDDAYLYYYEYLSRTSMTFMQEYTSGVTRASSTADLKIPQGDNVGFYTMTRNNQTQPLRIDSFYSFMWNGNADVGCNVFNVSMEEGSIGAYVTADGILFRRGTFETTLDTTISQSFSGEIGFTWNSSGVTVYFVKSNGEKDSYLLDDDEDLSTMWGLTLYGGQTCRGFKLTLEKLSTNGNSFGNDGYTIMYMRDAALTEPIAARESLSSSAATIPELIDDSFSSIQKITTTFNNVWNFKARKEYTHALFCDNTLFELTPRCYSPNACVLIEATYQDYLKAYVVQRYWKFGNNISLGDVSNNSTPTMLTNFTKYRLAQKTSRGGRSGTLKALLSNTQNSQYADTAKQMDTLYEASQSINAFFLRDMKGNFYQVNISAPITQSVNIKSVVQETTISVNWEESDDASIVAITGYMTKAN